MIDKSMLDVSEVEWLNQYHIQCLEQLSPYLSADEQRWLSQATQPI
jgi:Xaa-Pro aminopeptidase